MKKTSFLRDPKGEGLLPNLMLLLVLGGLAYGAYYFFVLKDKPSASASPTPQSLDRSGNDARPGSPAGAAAKQAEENGSVAAQ